MLPIREGTVAATVPGDFDCCLFMPSDASTVPTACGVLSSRLKPGGRLIVVLGDIFSDTVTTLAEDTPLMVSKLDGEMLGLQDVRLVPASATRRAVQRTMLQYARRATRGSRKLDLMQIGLAAGAAGGSLVCNAMVRSTRSVSSGRPVSSLFATFGKNPPALTEHGDATPPQGLEQAVDQ
jgi:hypothetical protein